MKTNQIAMVKSAQDKRLEHRERSRRCIAVIDDYEPHVKTISEVLNQAGYACRQFTHPHEFLNTLDGGGYDLVLVDLVMPDMDGFELLLAVKQAQPHLPVVMISGRGTIPTVVQAMKNGAKDFIEKDMMDTARIISVVNRVFEEANISRERMPSSLTFMQQQVLERVLLGYGNREIAQKLKLSVRTG